MNCLKPIMLKSGQLVPCGHCTLCQSSNRTEKSVLVQLHCDSFDRMPLFIGLSYDPEHLPLYCTCDTDKRLDHARQWSHARFYRKHDAEELKLSLRDDPASPSWSSRCLVPSLFRKDVSSFLKNYKRSCGLLNDQFTYFGCGEYGDTYDRPHYHLIWFGDTQLERLYDSSVHGAENWLSEFWQLGHVDINVAEWSGIHYVTKYCLKDNNNFPLGALPPFTIAGNGIGLKWLKTYQAERIRQQLLYCQFNKEKIFADINLDDLDWSDVRQRIKLLKQWIDYLKPVVPDFRITLPSGQKAVLPRKLKRIMLGSYQHFKDNPIWLYVALNEMLETDQYLLDHKDLDFGCDLTQAQQQREQRAIRIQQRINRNKKPLR